MRILPAEPIDIMVEPVNQPTPPRLIVPPSPDLTTTRLSHPIFGLTRWEGRIRLLTRDVGGCRSGQCARAVIINLCIMSVDGIIILENSGLVDLAWPTR